MRATSQALKDVTREFARIVKDDLDAATQRTFDRIYGVTLLNFIAKGTKAGVDVWGTPRFRAWILREVRKIARETSRRAGGRPVSPAVLEASARAVMKETKKKCDVAIEKGRVIVRLSVDLDDCEVCQGFVRSPGGMPAQ